MELWDVYDKDGNLAGRTMKRGGRLACCDYHLAMEAWIINLKGQILIQQRSEKCEILPRIWAHTTGRILAGEDSVAGCIREIKEELGIRVSPEDIHFIRRIIREDSTNLIWDVYVVVKDISLSGIRLQESEVAGVKWVSPQDIRNMLKNGDFFEYPEIYEILVYVEQLMDQCIAEKRY